MQDHTFQHAAKTQRTYRMKGCAPTNLPMQTPWGGSACWVETGHWWQSRSDSSPRPPPTLQAKQVCYISTQTLAAKPPRQSWSAMHLLEPRAADRQQVLPNLLPSHPPSLQMKVTPWPWSEATDIVIIYSRLTVSSQSIRPTAKMLAVLRVQRQDCFHFRQSSLVHSTAKSVIKISELPEWQAPLQLYVGRYYTQVRGNGCTGCLLMRHWVNLLVSAKEY